MRLFGKKGAADKLWEVRLRSLTGGGTFDKCSREHLRSVGSMQSLLERNGIKMSREQLNCAMHLDALVTLLLSLVACLSTCVKLFMYSITLIIPASRASWWLGAAH